MAPLTRDDAPTWPLLTAQLLRGDDLAPAQASWAMHEVMEGAARPVPLAGFLVALQAKGVTGVELAALADAMVEHALAVSAPERSVDIVGTGGDMAHTVNISTMSAVVISASGRPVVKHGNRASSSRSGSADVLEALGVRLDLSVPAIEALIAEVGISFLFAQVFHPSMRYAAEARKGLAVPTVMNVLGPITNPARPRASAVGVANSALAPTVASVFASRGTSALVFRGRDGLDELTVTAPSDVWEVRHGHVHAQVLDPSALLGIAYADPSDLRGGTAEENAQVARDVFAGQTGGRLQAVRDAVALNAAAGILAFDGIDAAEADGDDDFASRFTRAFTEAQDVLSTGRAADLIENWARASQQAVAR